MKRKFGERNLTVAHVCNAQKISVVYNIVLV